MIERIGRPFRGHVRAPFLPAASLAAVASLAFVACLGSGPTPSAAQGAATRAAGSFCGRDQGEPAAMQEAIGKADGVKQIYDGPEYVAFQDEKSEAVFTFTRAALVQAHPAVVCRVPVKDGDLIKLDMAIVCRGTPDGCSRLESEFKKLNAQMEAHIRGQAGVPADRPK